MTRVVVAEDRSMVLGAPAALLGIERDIQVVAQARDGERDPLHDRERRVLRLAGEGMACAAIASTLGLSEGTVRKYLSVAIGKLGASNRVEAARIAREKGWL